MLIGFAVTGNLEHLKIPNGLQLEQNLAARLSLNSSSDLPPLVVWFLDLWGVTIGPGCLGPCMLDHPATGALDQQHLATHKVVILGAEIYRRKINTLKQGAGASAQQLSAGHHKIIN